MQLDDDSCLRPDLAHAGTSGDWQAKSDDYDAIGDPFFGLCRALGFDYPLAKSATNNPAIKKIQRYARYWVNWPDWIFLRLPATQAPALKIGR